MEESERDVLTPDPGDLEELLRRCHRSELLPLADVLKVSHRGLGLSRLAHVCAVTLRRRGASDLMNGVMRGGDGPPYPELVTALAARHGVVAADGDVEETERRILRWWLQQAWDTIRPEDKVRIWAQLGESPPAPVDGEAALAEVGRHSHSPYSVAKAVVKVVRTVPKPLLPFAVAPGCLVMALLTRPRDEVVLPAMLEIIHLRQQVRHRVTVGVVGSPSSGKDAAIAAIFGLDSGNIDPVAGSTKEVEITRLPDATALYVVNTPGLGDVVETVTEEARQVLDLIDVYVYVVNAQGGVQARELADYKACLATGRPTLAVVNKIDTLREADRGRYLADAQQKLSAPDADFVAVAFDPLPQLSETPINLEPVRDWIAGHLEALGKDASELPWHQEGDAG